MLFIQNVLLLVLLLHKSSGQGCNGTQTFIKVQSVTLGNNQTVLLYNNPGNAVTAECQQRCLASSNCTGFLVDYTDASCFRAISNESIVNREPTISGMTSSYYQKACVKVPSACVKKLWALERVDGFELVGFSRTVIPNIQLGIQCGQLCLSETKFACRSAMYLSDRKECSLSSEDRRTQPSSFRATALNTQYWENQCAPNVFSDTSCSLEEYANSTICCADNKEENVTQFQCQQRCNNETLFNCRGFTFIPSREHSEASYCLLHSDDTSSIGPRGVQSLIGATYWEKVPCLPLEVTCTSAGMNVVLHSQDFRGRIYVVGQSEKCYTQGRQGRDVTLKIPLQQKGREFNTCGVMVAHSVGETNRTLLSTVVMVQYNSIIQRRGDRAVKVGCLLDSSSSKNVTLGVSLSFAGSNSASPGGATVINASTIPPTVSLRVVDRDNEDEKLQEVELGQNLQLRIDVLPENTTYDIHVFNLIAASGDGADTYLLLDQRGCPSAPQAFSALRRVRPGSRSLVGDFTAFKFPNSDVVRFRAMVHLCPNTCPPVECIVSLGRRRREVPPSSADFEELPVQLAIVVRVAEPESLHSSEYDVCMSWGTLLGVALAWILLQFIILAIWFFVLHFRRARRPQDETKLQDDFSEYDNRHVHWADT